jgi:phosphoglycolate phosphatase-like HAD superfamily hydrolase
MCAGPVTRPWDAFDIYLFDIDGTLLHCEDPVHYYAFCSVMQSIAGRPLTIDGVVAHGNTDIGILRDAFALAGLDESMWRSRLNFIRESMCSFVYEHQHDLRAVAMPCAHEVLQHLRSRNAILGVATGNLQGIGELKLKSAGLLEYFSFGAWSDACEYRDEVFQQANATAKAIAGEGASLCVVGDTPADIRAARRNGLAVIAVSTGIYSFDQLNQEQPDLCIHSLAELVNSHQSLLA